MALGAAVWGLCNSFLGPNLLQKPHLHSSSSSSSSRHTGLRPFRYVKQAIHIVPQSHDDCKMGIAIQQFEAKSGAALILFCRHSCIFGTQASGAHHCLQMARCQARQTVRPNLENQLLNVAACRNHPCPPHMPC